MSSILCPTCQKEVSPIPMRRCKCPHCREWITTRRENGKILYLTQEQGNKITARRVEESYCESLKGCREQLIEFKRTGTTQIRVRSSPCPHRCKIGEEYHNRIISIEEAMSGIPYPKLCMNERCLICTHIPVSKYSMVDYGDGNAPDLYSTTTSKPKGCITSIIIGILIIMCVFYFR